MRELKRMMALMQRPTRLWRIDEAAFLCDCKKELLYEAMREGKLKRNPQRRIPHSEVVRYLGGYDPFVEFAAAMQAFEGQAVDGNAGKLIERLEGLEAKITRLEQRMNVSGGVSQ